MKEMKIITETEKKNETFVQIFSPDGSAHVQPHLDTVPRMGGDGIR